MRDRSTHDLRRRARAAPAASHAAGAHRLVRERRGGMSCRLVEAARQVIYHQGVERMSVADVAQAAGVPSGNVYYHFKTNDDLVEAAMSALMRDGEEFLARVSWRRSPQAQLKAFARELVQDEHSTALYGCPFGSLVSELDKRDDAVSRQAGDMLLAPFIDWAEERFAAMGQRDPRELATTLFATYLGAACSRTPSAIQASSPDRPASLSVGSPALRGQRDPAHPHEAADDAQEARPPRCGDAARTLRVRDESRRDRGGRLRLGSAGHPARRSRVRETPTQAAGELQGEPCRRASAASARGDSGGVARGQEPAALLRQALKDRRLMDEVCGVMRDVFGEDKPTF